MIVERISLAGNSRIGCTCGFGDDDEEPPLKTLIRLLFPLFPAHPERVNMVKRPIQILADNFMIARLKRHISQLTAKGKNSTANIILPSLRCTHRRRPACQLPYYAIATYRE